MIRLTALNDDTSKSSEECDIRPKEPSEEVQEENALKLYNEALQEQKIGNDEKAKDLYQQLLTSNLLMKVKLDEEGTKSSKPDTICSIYSKPTHMLKYSCLKNLAVIAQKRNMLEEAFNYYIKALEVEGTDVFMWYQTGCVAMKLLSIATATEAFIKGLEFSAKHWPSFDKLIICLFVLQDYINCLLFISKAFELDVHYTRGQVLRDYILTEQPSLQFDIKHFFPKIDLHVNKKNNEKEEVKQKLLREALDIRNAYSEKCRSEDNSPKKPEVFEPKKTIKSASWSNLGYLILEIHEEMTNQEAHISLLTPVNLKKVPLEKQFNVNDIKNLNNENECVEKVELENECEEEKTKEKSDVGCEKKNRKNRGSALMEELLWGGKRRSARVRSSLRGNPEPMDVAEALRRILPRRLLHKTKQLKVENSKMKSAVDEDSMDTMDLYRLFEKQETLEEKKRKEELERSEAKHDIDKIVEKEGYFETDNETSDVNSFIDSENKKNIIEVLKSFVMALEVHWQKTWPNALPMIYIKCYQLMRKHYPLNFTMCTSESSFKDLVKEAGSILLYGELCIEYQTNSHNKEKLEIGPSLQIIFLQNLMELTDRKDMFPNDEKYFEFLVRLYWLRCRIFLANGQTNLAIVALNDVLACYELFPQYQPTILYLKNCRKHNIISKTITEEFLAFQSRKRSLTEVVRLYEDESYRELTEILKETFTTIPDVVCNSFKEQESELVDRQTQLSMLINGFYHLGEYHECIFWLETCCYEILQKSSSQDDEGESWMITFDRFLIAIEDCLKLGKTTITKSLPPNKVSRFVQTLCHAICKELEDSDRPPCPARPWIMLNTILIGMEEQDKPETQLEEDEEDENDIPSSILILFTAHEYLGRREWCNCNESVLLFLIMDQVIPHIRNPDWSSFRETIQQHLEQVVYCLYAHPNKKTKARYLTDHNVNSISLTWDRGIQLFDLFKPDEIPAYDSLRVNLINGDTEALFRKIAALIPDERDPVQISDQMTDFIVGKRNDVPMNNVKLPKTAEDLFYILGDYYFKTHEFAKAVNYLLIDLCANPLRVDSWASMALSKASILEQQLNSCNPLKDEEFLQDALSALRCYEHCLQLDNKQCALWIEYGSFVYTIHSFCSQRMKLESDSLSLEQFEELESTKNKMLDTAKQAFVNANLIWYELKEESERQDERWLHHYMLGKISEKNGDLNYFEHYEKAAELLYENEAEFPSKVGYTTPQTLAIEALEVYYRVHVCVIKNLELNEGKPLDSKTRQIFNKHLNLCSKGPFAKQISKGDLAKIKAKELEAAQNEKQLKICKSLLDDLITKIELGIEAENREGILTKEESKQNEKDHKNYGVKEEIVSVENNGNSDDEIKIINTFVKPKDEPNKKQTVDFKNYEYKNESDGEIKVIEEIKPQGIQKAMEKISQLEDRPKSAIKIVETASTENEHEGVIRPFGLGGSYRPRTEYAEDNYYVTLEDLKNMQQPAQKPKKKRLSQASVSSSSCESDEIRYDDDSSSSSSSTESSASSESSSSSSTDSSQTDGSETHKETKVTDEDEKQNEKEENSDFPGKNKKDINGDSDDSEYSMLKRCLAAFETCALRFPQHYKSVYRLAHFYFRSKEHRDIGKCRELLLGRYQTPQGIISGLFADRKNTNFFNGIWRIPAGDVDRPGSFASHMSRSVLLLMEVLRDLKDHKMLLEICLQLRKTPDPDKKYLREDERNQLSVQACNLTIQTLRKNVKDSMVMTLPIVLDCYRCYQRVQKDYPQKEGIYGDILLEAFKRLGKGDKCSLEQAIRFCQSELSTIKPKVPKPPISNQSLTPKPKSLKMKKQEKKKSLPKPQITAKAIPKPPKAKKPFESKKKPQLNALKNLPHDSAYWSSILKVSNEGKSAAELVKSNMISPQTYADFSRNAFLLANRKEELEKKLSDQGALKASGDQLKVGMSQQAGALEYSKPCSGMFFNQNYPVDFGNDTYKQLANKFWFNNSFYGSLENQKKNRVKATKPRSVLKPKMQKPEIQKAEVKKIKTNFNIDNILGKPSKPYQSTTSSSLTKAIEEKIKSISGEVNITKVSSSQIINLNTNRKTASDSGKRTYPDFSESVTVKKICFEQGKSKPVKKDEIEVVVIDD